VGKIAKKQSEGVRFVNSALKIQCHVVKNTNSHLIQSLKSKLRIGE